MFSIWSQAHPVLHSSPTRRSSDLAGIAVVDNGESFSVISQQPFRCHTPIGRRALGQPAENAADHSRSEEHTSELQSLAYLVCRLLLEKKNQPMKRTRTLLLGSRVS